MKFAESTASNSALFGRSLQTYSEFRKAALLYTRVFNYDEPDLRLNTNLLSALVHNGGSVVGVFASNSEHVDGGELIGFAYGFAGRDLSGRDYHYSQAATVATEYQGMGVGKMLKQLQKTVAQENGHTRMRWTFDPTLARNAHFNMNSLGACGIDFRPDYFDRRNTDRIIVNWEFSEADKSLQTWRSVHPPSALSPNCGVSTLVGRAGEGLPEQARWITLPARPPETEAERGRLQVKLRASIEDALSRGFVFISCQKAQNGTAALLAVPRDETERA
jgi:predicted GNAT superfamily acetyltransferase